MNSDALRLVESILDDAERLRRNLEKLRSECRPDDPELLAAIENAKENAALIKRIRISLEVDDNILEL